MEGSLIVLLRFPDQWPPQQPEQLLHRRTAQFTSDLTVEPDGGVCLRVLSQDDKIEQRFQRIAPLGTGYAFIGVIWGQRGGLERPTCFINGRELKRREDVGEEPLSLQLKPKSPDLVASVSVSPTALERMPAQDRLLLETLRDIEQKIAGHSSYDLIRLSALLRHLLLDGRPLIDQVNGNYRLQLRFKVLDLKVAGPVAEEIGPPEVHIHALSPDGLDSREVTSSQLLKSIVIESGSVQITAREIIRTVAHVLGGVHSEPAKEPLDGLLEQLAKELHVHKSPVVLYAIHDIARVVVHGLLPLAAAISARFSD